MIEAAAIIPKEQRFVYRITPQPGRLMLLKNIGGQMEGIAAMLEALSSEMSPPMKVIVAIARIETFADGAMEFEAALLPVPAEDAEQ